MKAARTLVLLWATAALLPSCASVPHAMGKIRLGMSKPELTRVMGWPASVEGPFQNQHGRTEEVWQYAIAPDQQKTGGDIAVGVLTSEVSFFDDPMEDQQFQFHFIDDRLAHWGPK